MTIDRRLSPLFEPEHDAPPKASDLELAVVDPQVARPFITAWHSRLPNVQVGPWKLAYAAHYRWTCYGVALWHNPSARTLPDDWLELRRMALPDDAPPHTASWMLGAMRKDIRKRFPLVARLISYQDEDVHTGTIYKAAGWSAGFHSKPRQRDRSGLRTGTNRLYRSDLNGAAPAAAGKTRWEAIP